MIKTCEYNDNPIGPLEVPGFSDILVLQSPCDGCKAINITRNDPRAVTFIGGEIFMCMLLSDRYPDEQLAASEVITLPPEEVTEIKEHVERVAKRHREFEEYKKMVGGSGEASLAAHQNYHKPPEKLP